MRFRSRKYEEAVITGGGIIRPETGSLGSKITAVEFLNTIGGVEIDKEILYIPCILQCSGQTRGAPPPSILTPFCSILYSYAYSNTECNCIRLKRLKDLARWGRTQNPRSSTLALAWPASEARPRFGPFTASCWAMHATKYSFRVNMADLTP